MKTQGTVSRRDINKVRSKKFKVSSSFLNLQLEVLCKRYDTRDYVDAVRQAVEEVINIEFSKK